MLTDSALSGKNCLFFKLFTINSASISKHIRLFEWIYQVIDFIPISLQLVFRTSGIAIVVQLFIMAIAAFLGKL